MRKVISILAKESRMSKDKKEYIITHLTVDDGTICEYYGQDVEIGDLLEVFHDQRWDKVKARKKPIA